VDHIEAFYNQSISQDIIVLIQSRTRRLAGHVAHMEQIGNTYGTEI
jgi:hypothetical protein